MKLYLFLMVIVLTTVFSACQKKQSPPIPNITCSNITQTINDTLIALITNQTSSSVTIDKIQNSVTTVVASQTGFEFWGPSISPDKSKFICFRSTTANSISVNDYTAAEMWLFNIDGSNGHSISTLSTQGLNAMGMAKWAPDGNHIIFAGEKNETDGNLHWNIYITDTLGTLGIKMNTRLGSFKYPTFANGDMTKIAYEAWNVGIINAGSVFDTELHVATINSGFQFLTETKLTSNAYLEYSPSFSIDNLTLVYCQNTSLAAGTAVILYTINISSATATKILDNNSINENPVWCTNNNEIYYVNKSGSACFRKNNRITPSGSIKALVYQKMNSDLVQIDVK